MRATPLRSQISGSVEISTLRLGTGSSSATPAVARQHQGILAAGRNAKLRGRRFPGWRYGLSPFFMIRISGCGQNRAAVHSRFDMALMLGAAPARAHDTL